MKFIKTTIIGGLVFLVPLVALVVVLAKVYEVMLIVAEPMAEVFPVDYIGGIALANIIAVLIILLICFLAGLLARAKPAQKFAETIENAILHKIPGYALVKGMTSSLAPEKTAHMHPVLVALGHSSRIGLEVDRTDSGMVSVYFPGSPNAWSGEVRLVTSEQVEALDHPVAAVIEHAEMLGRTSRVILPGQP